MSMLIKGSREVFAHCVFIITLIIKPIVRTDQITDTFLSFSFQQISKETKSFDTDPARQSGIETNRALDRDAGKTG